jgi:hypothetical protein
MAELGRISGQLLKDNLLRDGVDLSFRNGPSDIDLLYLDINNLKIAVNGDAPSYELDLDGQTIRTSNIKTDDLQRIANIQINSNTITSIVGSIDVKPLNQNLFHDRLTTSGLEFNDNFIRSFSDQNIVIDPNGSGAVNLRANINVTGDIAVSGNITMAGNLSYQGNIIIGDDVIDGEGLLPENDTVDFNVDFSQSLIPGIDLGYDLGIDENDSTPRRWAQAHIPDWTNIVNENGWQGSGIIPLSVKVSDQLNLDGVNNQIFATQSNEDVVLNPDTGVLYVEQLKFENNDITNLNSATPLQFASIGIGYLRIMGDNAFVLPFGDDSNRPVSPEVADTRWNTDQGHLECFDGSVYAISTGGGETVTTEVMEDLGNVYALILA